MMRTSVPLLVCFFSLFCGVVVIDLRVNSLEVDIPTLSSISFWLFLGCTILSIFGGIILGIARGVTLAVVWNIVYMFAVLYTSLDIGVDTFLAMMLGFGIVGGIVFGTAFGTSNDLLGDLAGSIVWTTAVFLIRIGVGQ